MEKYFITGSSYFIDKNIKLFTPKDDNLELIKVIKDIDIYDVVKEIYKGKEILLSNWNKAVDWLY